MTIGRQSGMSWKMAVMVLAAACAAPSCGPPPAPAPLPPSPATIAGACDRGRALHCAWAEPTAAGATCEQVIAESLATGIIALDLQCVASITTCQGEASCARNAF